MLPTISQLETWLRGLESNAVAVQWQWAIPQLSTFTNKCFALIFRSHFGTEPRPTELEEYPPMIALAVGKTAVVYDPRSGTRAGEEWMARFFGENLGLESKFESAGV
jgi:hypothetical protein